MNLQEIYNTKIKSELQKELKIKNPMAIPKLVKIVLNIGLGEALADHKALDRASEQLTIITGQKPLITKAKVAIATFKLRIGDKIGLKTTLRGKRMYVFFEKLISIALPRIRDFRGVSKKSFDGRGNYSLGIREQTVFPEIEYSKIDKIRGLEITFVTNAKNDEAGIKLLEKLGMPFEK